MTVRMCRKCSMHHRPGWVLIDRSGRGKGVKIHIPVDDSFVGNLHGP